MSIDIGNVRLDELAGASGFNKNQQAELEKFQRDLEEEAADEAALGGQGFNEVEPGEESEEEVAEGDIAQELADLGIEESDEVPVLADVCLRLILTLIRNPRRWIRKMSKKSRTKATSRI